MTRAKSDVRQQKQREEEQRTARVRIAQSAGFRLPGPQPPEEIFMLVSPQHASGRVIKAARLESPAEAAALTEGQPAPLFSLPDADMEMFDLASVLGSHHVVLYFYPRDNTPGCTRQAIDFSDHDADFAKEKCIVIGVSPDDCLTHADFRDQHGLSVELLSDEDGEACRLYGVWQSAVVDGVMKRSVRRSTFIISSDGVLRHVFHDVNPRGHAAEVFQLVKQLNSRNVNGNRQEHGRHA